MIIDTKEWGQREGRWERGEGRGERGRGERERWKEMLKPNVAQHRPGDQSQGGEMGSRPATFHERIKEGIGCFDWWHY